MARSLENKLRIKASLNLRIKKITKKATSKPRMKMGREVSAKSPKRASINSSLGVNNAPRANEPEKITPMVVSVESPVFFSSFQIKTAPTRRAPAAPMIGLIWRVIARAKPGRATCEMASAARVILFIKAKLPMRPAATAAKIAMIME